MRYVTPAKSLILSFLTINHAIRIFSSHLPVCPYHANLIRRVVFGGFKTDSKVMLGRNTFLIGSEPPVAIPGDGETPLRSGQISQAFWIDITEVTVQSYLEFTKATGYTTTAENYGNTFSFWMEDNAKLEEIKSRGPWWWLSKEGRNWKNAGNNPHEKSYRRNLPVNHVSWDDALSFCQWKGGRLPTELEWEYACRGGLENMLYPWGNKLKINGSHMTNIWQGKFPVKNTKTDGFTLRAPIASFPCNSYGLHDMVGNVWEWVDGEWSEGSPEHFNKNVRVQKGGSYLCHRNHCFRYRCSARTKASRDSTASNVGFRCAYDL